MTFSGKWMQRQRIRKAQPDMHVANSDQLKGFIQPTTLEEGSKPVFGILIDGKNISIEYIDVARYLDGDVWVALEENGEQFFMMHAW